MLNVEVIVPVVAGEKFTAIVHDVPPPANVLPQVVFMPSTAYAGFAVVMLLIAIVPPAVATLLFVTVMNLSGLVVPCSTAPKLTDVGMTTGAESVPVPLCVIDAGLFLALLVKVSAPVTRPGAVGENVVMTVQLLLAGSTPVHPSFAMLNGPEIVTLLIVIPTELGLLTVAVCVALVWPTRVLGKTLVADRLIFPLTPVPLSVTVCGLLGDDDGMVIVPFCVPTAVAM